MEDLESFGAYLRRLRESKELTLRQAAHRAGVSSGYLSQIEGGKRGKRKGGEHFAPHPQILKKLAEVYHVPAEELFERAGFFDQEQSYQGFSEEREIDRCFEFLLHDPVFKRTLTTLDKRAIVDRYEALTGKKLITWGGEYSPTAKKSDFKGLRLSDGVLYADTVHVTLTLAEVAQELGTDVKAVKRLIQNGYLRTSGGTEDLIDKAEVRDIKQYLAGEGLRLMCARAKRHKPKTDQEYRQAAEEIRPTVIEGLKREVREKTRARQNARKRERSGQ